MNPIYTATLTKLWDTSLEAALEECGRDVSDRRHVTEPPHTPTHTPTAYTCTRRLHTGTGRGGRVYRVHVSCWGRSGVRVSSQVKPMT